MSGCACATIMAAATHGGTYVAAALPPMLLLLSFLPFFFEKSFCEAGFKEGSQQNF